MRNLDAIINQLANEQQRTEHLLVDDLKGIKKEAQLFFDKQAREFQSFYEQRQKESDAYMALLATRFDDLIVRIQHGYPKEEGFRELTEDPVPAFLMRPKAATENVLANIEEMLKAPNDQQQS
jgi:hypothetical protein